MVIAGSPQSTKSIQRTKTRLSKPQIEQSHDQSLSWCVSHDLRRVSLPLLGTYVRIEKGWGVTEHSRTLQDEEANWLSQSYRVLKGSWDMKSKAIFYSIMCLSTGTAAQNAWERARKRLSRPCIGIAVDGIVRTSQSAETRIEARTPAHLDFRSGSQRCPTLSQ